MKIIDARISGTFILEHVGPGHRANAYPMDYYWTVSDDHVFRNEHHHVDADRKFDGTSRPWAVGWLVPRWGSGAVASLFHDDVYANRPVLSNGERISRKEADLCWLAFLHVASTWPTWLMEAAWRGMHLFSAPTWNKHDPNFPDSQK